jgi:hypothetical protein
VDEAEIWEEKGKGVPVHKDPKVQKTSEEVPQAVSKPSSPYHHQTDPSHPILLEPGTTASVPAGLPTLPEENDEVLRQLEKLTRSRLHQESASPWGHLSSL